MAHRLPALLYPPELRQAQRLLRAQRWQRWLFWLLVWPAALVAGIALGTLFSTGVPMGFVLLCASFAAMVTARVWVARRQAPARQAAHETVDRWRRLPADPRWDAAVVLLQRIAALGAMDADLRETAQRLVGTLFWLYEDVRRLERTLDADRVLDGEGAAPSERYYRLLAIRTRREAQITELLNGLRDLHIEINEQLAEEMGPVQLRLQEMMDRMEADREVARIAGVRRKALEGAHP